MKIKDIKSDEVRDEAVRLAIENQDDQFEPISTESEALDCLLIDAFNWSLPPYFFEYWNNIDNGKTPNTPDLKLPKK
jgi:hypothetical protein